MKTITLSDHATDQLEKRAAERENKYMLELKAYMDRLEAIQAKIDALGVERKRAWRRKGYLHVLTYTLAIMWARCCKRKDEKRRPTRVSPGTEDIIWKAGLEGEQIVEIYLASRLDDEWTLLGGYRNGKGEIDKILCGPGGIYAIEAKNHTGIISCHGHMWSRDKFDRWGNLVRSEMITDRGGRSPSRQVGEPAGVLESFLVRTFPGCRVCPIVVFAHDGASFGEMRDVPVKSVLLREGWDLREMVGQRIYGPKEVERMVALIAKDHHFYAKRPVRPAPMLPELMLHRDGGDGESR